MICLAVLVGHIVAGAVWLQGPLPRAVLDGEGEHLWPVRFSPDSQWLVVERRTAKIDLLDHQVWNLTEGRAVLRFGAARVYARAFSDDSRWFAQAFTEDDSAKNTRVGIWDLETGQELRDLRWANLPGAMPWNMSGSSLAFTSEKQLLLGAANFDIWDVIAKRKIAPFEMLVPIGPMPHNWETSLFGFPGEGGRHVRLYSLATRTVVGEFALPKDIRNFRWSEDGQVLAADLYLYAGDQDLVGIHVCDARTGIRRRLANVSDCSMQSVSSDGRWLAVSTESAWSSRWRRLWGMDGLGQSVIRIIDVSTGEPREDIPGRVALFAPDAQTLAVRTVSGNVEIWDIPPPEPWLRCVVWGLAAALGILILRLGWRFVSKRIFALKSRYGASRGRRPDTD
ncbi:MAG: hypothetical protein L0215_24640 [Gemmataceae bacterium]|nr:hypothetical protein [Gemmataceae bacterium]